jgi:hypothetical protein
MVEFCHLTVLSTPFNALFPCAAWFLCPPSYKGNNYRQYDGKGNAHLKGVTNSESIKNITVTFPTYLLYIKYLSYEI